MDFGTAPHSFTIPPDMMRIGRALADDFCKELSGNDKYFELDAGPGNVTEAA
jgi:hypothetical protein